MLRIRLFKIGYKKHPFYRIVAIDIKKKRNSIYKENLGYLDPIKKDFQIDINRVNYFLKCGSQLSNRVFNLLRSYKH